jgi:hypothetical protein
MIPFLSTAHVKNIISFATDRVDIRSRDDDRGGSLKKSKRTRNHPGKTNRLHIDGRLSSEEHSESSRNEGIRITDSVLLSPK